MVGKDRKLSGLPSKRQSCFAEKRRATGNRWWRGFWASREEREGGEKKTAATGLTMPAVAKRMPGYFRRRSSSSDRPPKPASASVVGSGTGATVPLTVKTVSAEPIT